MSKGFDIEGVTQDGKKVIFHYDQFEDLPEWARTELKKEYERLKREKEHLKLWEFNEECPQCGRKVNHRIRACETGLSYCSYECAEHHVNKNTPEGGY